MAERTNGRRTLPKRIETRLVTAGRDPESYHGFVNPPVYHASTVLYPSAEDYVAHRARYHYGRRGTPTTEALELALQDLDGPNCAIVLKPVPQKAVYAFLDALELFGIGPSWGGYESLATPFDCTTARTATRWQPGGPTVRFHIGLEAVEDLTADLERGFATLAATCR